MPFSGRILFVAFMLVLSASAASAAAGGGTAPDSSGAQAETTVIVPPTDRPYARTDGLTLAVLGMGALHHVDHVLRANHSGWPFTPSATAFTYSLAIYPIVGAAYLADAGPLTFVVIDAAGTLGLALAHTLLEPPRDQYEPWADGSNELGARSPGLGRLSQAVSAGLSLSLVAHLVSSILDGREHGLAWRRPGARDRTRRAAARLSFDVRREGGAWSMVVPLGRSASPRGPGHRSD